MLLNLSLGFVICLVTCPGSPRPPFDDIIQRLVALKINGDTHQKSPAIISIDIPSGWHVEEGDLSGEGIKPDMLVCICFLFVFNICNALLF